MVTDSCLVRFMPRFFPVLNNKKLSVLFYGHNDCCWDVWSVFSCRLDIEIPAALYRSILYIHIQYYCVVSKNEQIRIPSDRIVCSLKMFIEFFQIIFFTKLCPATKLLQINRVKQHSYSFE